MHISQPVAERVNPRESAAVENVRSSLTFEKKEPQQHHYTLGAECERVADKLIGVHVWRVGKDYRREQLPCQQEVDPGR
jgi:hypothetical protein